jgi:capsule polysaccharide export protein KpsE/RkpR
MDHTLHFFQLLKDTQMTLHETKAHDTSTAATVQQHHTQAAEHLELAAKSHKEAAKLVGANDHTAAHAHVKTAQEHVAKAQDHVVEAAKKTISFSK